MSEFRIGHVNADHLFYGYDKGYSAALRDHSDSTASESKAVTVVKLKDVETLQSRLREAQEFAKRETERKMQSWVERDQLNAALARVMDERDKRLSEFNECENERLKLKAEHERKEVHWGEIKQQLIDKHKAKEAQFEKDYQDCLDDRASIYNRSNVEISKLKAEVARLQGENEHLEMVVDSKQEFLDGETECRKLRERQLEIAKDTLNKIMSGLTTRQSDVESMTKRLSHQTLIEIEALELEANENGVKS